MSIPDEIRKRYLGFNANILNELPNIKLIRKHENLSAQEFHNDLVYKFRRIGNSDFS